MWIGSNVTLAAGLSQIEVYFQTQIDDEICHKGFQVMHFLNEFHALGVEKCHHS